MPRFSFRRALIALGLAGCAPSPAAEAVRRSGTLADVPGYLSTLQESTVPGAYLIIEVGEGAAFVQFTASPAGVELDMPLISARQRTLGPRFRTVASDLEIPVRESRGSDGSRFLDVDLLPGPAAGELARDFVARLFELDQGVALVFVCHGC